MWKESADAEEEIAMSFLASRVTNQPARKTLVMYRLNNLIFIKAGDEFKQGGNTKLVHGPLTHHD
jgi:hypothetical protein